MRGCRYCLEPEMIPGILGGRLASVRVMGVLVDSVDRLEVESIREWSRCVRWGFRCHGSGVGDFLLAVLPGPALGVRELHVVDYYEGEARLAFDAAGFGADVADGAGLVVGVYGLLGRGGWWLGRVSPIPASCQPLPRHR